MATYQDGLSHGRKDTQDNDLSTLQEKIGALEEQGSSLQQVLKEKYREKAKLLGQLQNPSILRRTRILLLLKRRNPSIHDQFSTLDSEIEEKQTILKGLTRDLDSVRANLQSRTNQLSMAKIPTELWANIFFFCLPDLQFVVPHSREAPLLLCQICKIWREIVMTTPHLWSSLSICRPVCKTLIKAWLDRAGATPLSLEISLTSFMEGIVDSVRGILLSTKDRWCHLRLDLGERFLPAILSNHFPSLHTIEFGINCPMSRLALDPTRFPNLRDVHLVTFVLEPKVASFPWDKLTHCSSRRWLTLEQHMDVLRRCPGLKYYQLYFFPTPMQPESGSLPLVLPCLQTLEIVASTGGAMGPVLSRLELPALSELTFEVPIPFRVRGIDAWPQEHVLSLVKRSSCKLRKIAFEGIAKSPGELDHVKEMIPSLRSVELRRTVFLPSIAY